MWNPSEGCPAAKRAKAENFPALDDYDALIAASEDRAFISRGSGRTELRFVFVHAADAFRRLQSVLDAEFRDARLDVVGHGNGARESCSATAEQRAEPPADLLPEAEQSALLVDSETAVAAQHLPEEGAAEITEPRNITVTVPSQRVGAAVCAKLLLAWGAAGAARVWHVPNLFRGPPRGEESREGVREKSRECAVSVGTIPALCNVDVASMRVNVMFDMFSDGDESGHVETFLLHGLGKVDFGREVGVSKTLYVFWTEHSKQAYSQIRSWLLGNSPAWQTMATPLVLTNKCITRELPTAPEAGTPQDEREG